jgi:hypothetical protein
MPVLNYEPLNPSTDITLTRTLLHEAVPLTGAIVSGTYGTYPNGGNIKNYTHGMFQSVYDYPFLSSSANHIFDMTMGYDESSVLSGATSVVQNSKKINMYNEIAQVLLGYTGSNNQVEIFESDLNISDNNNQMKEVFFITLSRLLMKDQIKKGTFSISLGTGSIVQTGIVNGNPFVNASGTNTVATLTDASASADDTGTSVSQGGQYGVLFEADGTAAGTAYGVVFYQAGIVALTASLWPTGAAGGVGDNTNIFYHDSSTGTNYTVDACMASASISGSCDALRRRVQNISFNNTTEINSSIYFCRVPFNKFNYSSNATYVSGSKIRVKNFASDPPVSYITTVGLYSATNELLAVAKLSEPLRKSTTTDMTLRVRLDY